MGRSQDRAAVAQRPSKRCVHAVASIGTSFGPGSVTDIGSAKFTGAISETSADIGLNEIGVPDF
jgi:hypothetical protein